MAIVNHALRSITVAEETSFAITEASNTFLPIPAVAGSMSWTKDDAFADPNPLQQYHHGVATQVLATTKATVTFDVPLGLTGTLADSSTASVTQGDSAVLNLMYLGFSGGAMDGGNEMGTTVSVSDTASSFTVASATNIAAGNCIGWANAAGNIEMREVQAVTGAVVTLKHSFSATPQVNDEIYQAVTFFPSRSSANLPTAQFLIHGFETDEYYRLFGCQLQSFGLSVPYGEVAPMLSMTWKAAKYQSIAAAALTAQTYSNHTPIAFSSGELLAQVVGTATRQIISTYGVDYSCAYTTADIVSPEGTNGITGYKQMHAQPFAELDIGTYFQDTAWDTALSTPTLYNFSLQVGLSASGGILIAAPTCQIVSTGSTEDAGGLAGQKLHARTMLDTDCGDGASGLKGAPLRFHIIG